MLAAAAVACFGTVAASTAVAATVTIGAPDVSGTQGQEQCPGTPDTMPCKRTLAQLTQPSPGVLLTAPADGVITTWHVHGNTAAGVNGSLALRVLRRDPDGVRFTAVATSAGVTAFFNDGSPDHAVSIPVLAGDYIGVDMSRSATTLAGAPVWVYYTQPAGASYGVWEGGLADGSTLAPPSTVSSARLMLNAVESLRPVVSGVSPSSGSTAGGQAVTITGSNLDGPTGVSFAGTPAASFTPVSPTQITATAPARAAGPVDVQVTSPGGVSAPRGADLYTYIAPSGGGTTGGTTGGGGGSASVASAGHASARGPTANVPVTCTGPSGGNCSITVTMTVTETLRGNKLVSVTKANAKRPKKTTKVVTVGSASVVVPAGTTQVVGIPLNSAGTYVLSTRGKLRLSIVVSQTTGGTSKVVSTQKLTLEASKGKRKKKH